MDQREGVWAIAVVGGSGAGKSTIAHAAAARLADCGLSAHVVSEDDFYHPRARFPAFDAATHNFDEPAAKDLALLTAVLRQARGGAEALVPQYDFVVHDRAGWRALPKADVLVFEGLHLLCEPELRQLFDLKVYVDADPAARFDRRLARDVAERGRMPEDVRAQFESRVAPMHAAWVSPQRSQADLVLVNDASCETALRMTVERLVAEIVRLRP